MVEANFEEDLKEMLEQFNKEKVYKKSIVLTESDLKYVISESVRRIIKEYTDHSFFGGNTQRRNSKMVVQQMKL